MNTYASGCVKNDPAPSHIAQSTTPLTAFTAKQPSPDSWSNDTLPHQV
ncbi:hypothetical protein BIFGAL_03932 [Bifidobacterium gallicum DSM 20093 = LMG 11596]|nr:hypothetical protein BIFGAL_03932 [Bifidobacterium gallicum DSM 20093 = LMG 11596]